MTTSPGGAAISFADVSVHFPGAPAPSVRGVTLHCAPGEFVVLVGRSGSGKTTLLNLAAGLIQPTSGTVTTLGVAPKLARSQVGYMFARDSLLPWRSARRNVELGLEILRQDRRQRSATALAMLQRLGLGDAATKLPWQLSQGMRQRVALARTWARDPSILLMDEPFSALDAQTREAVQDEFLELWASSRRSVLLVTHDLTEALLLGDRVLVIADGEIVKDIRVPYTRPRQLSSLAATSEFKELAEQLHRPSPTSRAQV